MAHLRTERADPGMRAGYLGGDPAWPEPQPRGRLGLVDGTLRFEAPGAPDVEIPVEDLEGISLSGRQLHRHGAFSRAIRGTMWVAAWRDGEPAVWEFAIDRSEGAALRDRINSERQTRGTYPLPFVEELSEFPSPLLGDGDGSGALPLSGNGARHPDGLVTRDRAVAIVPTAEASAPAPIDATEGQDDRQARESLRDFARRRPRLVIALAAIAAIVVLAEVLIPVILS